MYLVLNYDSEKPKDTVKSGLYNNHNCGGECKWHITTSYPANENDYIGVCLYNGEKFFYLFDFYDEDTEETILCKHMKDCFSVVRLNETMYISLCDRVLDNYDYEEETITIDGEDDADALGGIVLYGKLNK